MCRVIFGFLLIVGFFTGCAIAAKQSTPLPENSDFRYFTHTVSFKGETLSLLAEWYLGSADKVLTLSDMNGIVSSRGLQIGDTVRIPSELAVTRTLPSEDVVVRHFQRIRKRKPIDSGTTDALLFGENSSLHEIESSDPETTSLDQDRNLQDIEENQEISEDLREKIVAPLLDPVTTRNR